MRRTVWMVVMGLLVLAVVAQSVTLVRNRHFDEFTDIRVEPDGRTFKVRNTAPRYPSMSSRDSRARSGSSSRPVALPFDEREEKKVESRPKVKSEAYDDALDKAREWVANFLHLSTLPSREYVNRYVKVNYLEEKGPSDSVIGDTFVVKMDLELTPEVARELLLADRSSESMWRMQVLARFVGVLVVLFGCVAGYIRIDEYTKGYYTGRLRVLAVLVVVAAGFVLIAHH
jgi:hypothetical protein